MTVRISTIGLGFAVRRDLVILHTLECSPRWGCPALAVRRRAVQVDASSCSIIAAPKLEVCVLYDLHMELVPFDQAWVQQVAVLEDTIKQIEAESPGHSGSVILLQHPPVFTLGQGSTTDHLRFNPEQPPYPLIRTERGGEVTYHGPGQLVLYPIMNLRHYKQDLHCYLRGLEEVIIRTLDSVSGIKAGRIEGLTGVWVNDAKVAAIGIRARRWVTYHGLAINVITDLAPFQHIVPCGIADKAVTSVKELLQAQTPGPWGPAEDAALMEEYAHGLLAAFSEVFNVTLVEAQESQQLLVSGGLLLGQCE